MEISPDFRMFRKRRFLSLSSPGTVAAFTLIELLAVMAIMMILVALVVPAVSGIGRAAQLGTEGSRVADLADFARQNSIARNAMTALVMVTDSSMEERNRAFAVFELKAKEDGSTPLTSDWKQISKWEVLNRGVIADTSTFPNESTSPPVPFPPFLCGAKTVASFQYALFFPTGGMLGSDAVKIRLAEGVWPANAASPQYTHFGTTGAPSNYFQVCFLPATGRQKIERP